MVTLVHIGPTREAKTSSTDGASRDSGADRRIEDRRSARTSPPPHLSIAQTRRPQTNRRTHTHTNITPFRHRHRASAKHQRTPIKTTKHVHITNTPVLHSSPPAHLDDPVPNIHARPSPTQCPCAVLSSNIWPAWRCASGPPPAPFSSSASSCTTCTAV